MLIRPQYGEHIPICDGGNQCSVRRGRAKQVYLNFAERKQVRGTNVPQLTTMLPQQPQQIHL